MKADIRNRATTAPFTQSQVLQIWFSGQRQVLMLDVAPEYRARLTESLEQKDAPSSGHPFLILRHPLASAVVINLADLQAVRAIDSGEVTFAQAAPHGGEVWIALRGARHPVLVRMDPADAWQLADVFSALELGLPLDETCRLHGHSGDLLTIRGREVVWMRASDSLLQHGRLQVALQDGLPAHD